MSSSTGVGHLPHGWCVLLNSLLWPLVKSNQFGHFSIIINRFLPLEQLFFFAQFCINSINYCACKSQEICNLAPVTMPQSHWDHTFSHSDVGYDDSWFCALGCCHMIWRMARMCNCVGVSNKVGWAVYTCLLDMFCGCIAATWPPFCLCGTLKVMALL